MIYLIPNWLRKYLSPEDFLTIQCANYLRSKGVLFTHTFNEGKRSRTMQSKLKGFGVLTGLPDFIIFEAKNGFNGLCVELKVKYKSGAKNYLSPAQKEAHKKLTIKGYLCETIYNIDDFIVLIDKYLEKK
jgi:hypothetical protein